MKGGWHTSKYTNFKNKQIVGFTKQSEPNNYENKTTVTEMLGHLILVDLVCV
jgi:hypothetical protein